MADEAKRWLLHIEGRVWGPYSTAQLRLYLDRGDVKLGVFAAREDGSQWTRLGNFLEFDRRGLLAPGAPLPVEAEAPTTPVAEALRSARNGRPGLAATPEEEENRQRVRAVAWAAIVALFLTCALTEWAASQHRPAVDDSVSHRTRLRP